jgi:hypothetical protein
MFNTPNFNTNSLVINIRINVITSTAKSENIIGTVMWIITYRSKMPASLLNIIEKVLRKNRSC